MNDFLSPDEYDEHMFIVCPFCEHSGGMLDFELDRGVAECPECGGCHMPDWDS
jgi:transcription elongation factor Elf1